jgi:hypothetical protein
MLKLKRHQEDGTLEEKTIEDLPAVLGRLDRCAWSVDDASVSREHARLFMSGGRLCIADLNSSNGTFVNGKKVSRSAVEHGDTIRLGRISFVLQKAVPAGEAAGIGADAAAVATAPEKKPAPAPPEFDLEDSGESEGVDIPDAEGIDIPDAPPPQASAPPETPSRPEPASKPKPAAPKRPAAPKSPAPVTGGSASVQVKDRILQYNRIPADRKAGLLRGDFSQYHPLIRVGAILAVLVLAVALFFLVKHLTRTAVPASWEDAPAPSEYYEETDYGE